MAYQQRKPEFPKPFDFVPFTDRVDQRRVPGHESFHLDKGLSGQLAYELIIQTPLHISSGNYALTEDLGLKAANVLRDMYRVTVDGRPLPAVPGSTMKGVTRAIVEAVTHSCLGVVTRWQRRDLPHHLQSACRQPRLCPACGLYGAMSRLGRLSFSDALFHDGDARIIRMPALYRPRPNDARAYKKHDRFWGRKFYYHGRPAKQEGHYAEALIPGTILHGNVLFSGISEAELGLLCFALGLDGSFQMALGGGKPVALGRVKIQATALHLQQSASFTQYEAGDAVLTDEPLTAAVQDYLRRAGELIQAEQRDDLREILDPANQRPAPTGVY
ncbi:MAG: hypothetical protein GY803_09940 [Chloroflexi bacterium]|nr:hypothetical protein [Chloroflexota bacterium]